MLTADSAEAQRRDTGHFRTGDERLDVVGGHDEATRELGEQFGVALEFIDPRAQSADRDHLGERHRESATAHVVHGGDVTHFTGADRRHLAGDEVISSVARLMAAMLGDLGLLARVGGEEFALLSAGVPIRLIEDKLAAVCDRLATTPILTQGFAVQVTISAGVALSRAGETLDQLYAAADRAL